MAPRPSVQYCNGYHATGSNVKVDHWSHGTYVAGSEDGGVPVGHHDVVIVGQAIAAGVIADAFLSLLELLQELKVAWN